MLVRDIVRGGGGGGGASASAGAWVEVVAALPPFFGGAIEVGDSMTKTKTEPKLLPFSPFC